MNAQSSLDLGEAILGADPEMRPAIARDDPLPPGPYSVGLTHWITGNGEVHDGPPFTVVCGDGRAVAGHVESRLCAEAVASALNRCHPNGE